MPKKPKIFSGVRSVVYFSRDLPKAADWYEHILDVAPYRNDKDFVGFHLEDCDLCFHRLDEKSAPQSGAQVLYWVVKDLEETVKALTSEGCTIYRKAMSIPEGGRVTQLMDPFGNILGLTELQ